MENNFIEQLRKSAKTPEAAKIDQLEEQKRLNEKFNEIDRQYRERIQSCSIETIHSLFAPISTMIKETAIKAVEKALYTEKKQQKYLEGQIRIQFPYSSGDYDKNGSCYCCFQKKIRKGLKKQIVAASSEKIIIKRDDYNIMQVPYGYCGQHDWATNQIGKFLKKAISENIDGAIIKKDAILARDYLSPHSSLSDIEYYLDFKIFF